MTWTLCLPQALPFPTGPVVATENASGVRIVEAVLPFYQEAREEFGLAADDVYTPWHRRGREGEPRSTSARWSPAELAVLRWYESVRHRLVSSTSGLPFLHLKAVLAQMRLRFNFQRTTQQWSRKTKQLEGRRH